MREKLISLGITEEESDLYLIMLQAGGGYASKLAKLAQRKRSSTYHTLEKLVAAGLARKSTRGKYNYFSPEPPEKLVQLSKLRLDTASSLLPELLSIQNTRSDKPRVQFFETFEGIEQIFQDSLNAKGEILGYTNLSLLNELFPEFFRSTPRLE